MGIISSIFGKNSTTKISTYEEFWAWFIKNERTFFKVIQSGNDIDKDFFSKLSVMLDQLHKEIFFLAGMKNENTAELTFSADGAPKTIPYIEELMKVAPDLPGWKLNSLKPASAIDHMVLNMGVNTFSKENLFFYANEHENAKDQIDLVIVHTDFQEAERSNFVIGASIFLENYLGELNMLTMIDDLYVIGKEEAVAELIPISKLRDYLIWREKEFVEKYGALRYQEVEDSFNSLEAETMNGNPLVAIVNSSILEWDGKASHPWVLAIDIKYNGGDRNGMPDQMTYDLMNQFEDQLLEMLRPVDGHLNVGRETADGVRTIYFACADFREPVQVVDSIIWKYTGKLDVDYEIYKDKYWRTFDRFIPQVL